MFGDDYIPVSKPTEEEREEILYQWHLGNLRAMFPTLDPIFVEKVFLLNDKIVHITLDHLTKISGPYMNNVFDDYQKQHQEEVGSSSVSSNINSPAVTNRPPVAGTSGGNLSGAGTSGAGTSGGNLSGAGTSGAGTSGVGTSGTGTSRAGTSAAGISAAGFSGAGTSGASTSGAGTSGAGRSGTDISGAGFTGAAMSGASTSGAGSSSAGTSGTATSSAGNSDADTTFAKVPAARARPSRSPIAGASNFEAFKPCTARRYFDKIPPGGITLAQLFGGNNSPPSRTSSAKTSPAKTPFSGSPFARASPSKNPFSGSSFGRGAPIRNPFAGSSFGKGSPIKNPFSGTYFSKSSTAATIAQFFSGDGGSFGRARGGRASSTASTFAQFFSSGDVSASPPPTTSKPRTSRIPSTATTLAHLLASSNVAGTPFPGTAPKSPPEDSVCAESFFNKSFPPGTPGSKAKIPFSKIKASGIDTSAAGASKKVSGKWHPAFLHIPDTIFGVPVKPKSAAKKLEEKQIALYIDNDEFLAELMLNEDFMASLDEDTGLQGAAGGVPDMQTFKNRLQCMRSVTRIKFYQLSRIYERQRRSANIKTTVEETPSIDSLTISDTHSEPILPKKKDGKGKKDDKRGGKSSRRHKP